MITRKRAQKVVDQCNLISILALHHNAFRRRISDCTKSIIVIRKSPEDCTSEIASYKEELKELHRNCRLCKTAIKWTQKGLTVLQGSTKEPRHPYLFWDRSKYGDPKIHRILEVTARVLENIESRNKQDK